MCDFLAPKYADILTDKTTYMRRVVPSSVDGVHPVGRVEAEPCGHAGGDEGHVGRPAVGLRVIENNKLVVVGVAKKLTHNCALKPGQNDLF